MPIFILVVIALIVLAVLFLIIRAMIAPKRTAEIQKMIEAGKYSTAIKLAKKVLEKNEHNFLAQYYLGKAYLANNQQDLAMEQFQTINDKGMFNASFPESMFRKDMAEMYKMTNQVEEALKEYLLLTKLEPRVAEHYFEAAKLFEQRDKPEQAFKYYKIATENNPKYVEAHLALSKLLISSKKLIDAKKQIEYTIKISPDTYSAYYYQGKIMKEMKEFSAAVNAFEKASRDPEFRQRSFLERGLCFMDANHNEKAIPDFERSLTYSKNDGAPETIYARYFLAMCYEKNLNIDAAIKQWEAILKVKRSFKDVNAKLEQYKDLTENDQMKDYLTSTSANFLTLCTRITENCFGLQVQDSKTERYGAFILASQSISSMQKNFLYFFRDSTPVGESFLRTVLEEGKQAKTTRNVIVSNSGFTTAAYQFAEGRPFELINKEKLESLLESMH